MAIYTTTTAILMTIAALLLATASAQAPDPSDPATSSGPACDVDADCESGNWCREGFCAAYVAENDWCGGLLPPQDERRCATGFKCTDFPGDFEPLLADGNGYCRRLCSSSRDCAGDDYCGEEGVCRASGSCKVDKDCMNADNDWVHPLCFGTSSCNTGQCAFTCTRKNGPIRPLNTKEKSLTTFHRRPLAQSSRPNRPESSLAKIDAAPNAEDSIQIAEPSRPQSTI